MGGYIALVLLIAVHEFGHWLAAVMCGFCRLEVRFSVIRWRRKKGWDLAWDVGYLLNGITNVHVTRAEYWLRLRYLFFALSGPCANLVLAFGMIGLSTHLHGLPAEVTTMFGVGSALLGVGSLVPRNFKYRRTDGQRLIDALFNTEDMRRVRFGAQLHDNVAPLRALYQAKAWTELLPRALSYLDECQRLKVDESIAKSLRKLVSASRAGLASEMPTSTDDQYPAALPK